MVTYEAIREIAGKVVHVFRIFIQTAASLWQVVICYGYMILWESKLQTRQWLTASARVVLFTSTLVFLVEAATHLFSEHAFKIKLPLWVKIAVMFLAVWMVIHRWKEMRDHQRATFFASRMAELFQRLGAVNLGTFGSLFGGDCA